MHVEDHGIEEAFCPRCFDYRPGEVKVQEPPGVAGWFCPACGYADEPDRIPHDVGEYDAFVERGWINEARL